jgi:hypothetical protein
LRFWVLVLLAIGLLGSCKGRETPAASTPVARGAPAPQATAPAVVLVKPSPPPLDGGLRLLPSRAGSVPPGKAPPQPGEVIRDPEDVEE